MVGYAHRRYPVEQFHEEAKQELGWDQYQGRLWMGFHRHAVLVMLADSFLVLHELKQRREVRSRGRPRDPFPPSAGSTPAKPGGDSSSDHRVVAPSSRALVDQHAGVPRNSLHSVLTK